MKLIDLSVVVENSPSEPMKIGIDRLDWFRGAKQFCRRQFWNDHLPLKLRVRRAIEFLRGHRRLRPSDFPSQAFLSLDTVTMPTHMGTHMDAPFHYGPRADGAPPRTIDEVPLDWCYAPGVRLDLTHKRAGETIDVPDIKAALERTGHRLEPGHIVLIWTGTDRLWGKREYFSGAPGMNRAATEWLVEQGIRVIGIDTYGFDRPFPAMLEDFWRTGDRSHLWPAHFYGREREYLQIERLTNLQALPSTGFYVSCFPLRMKGVDASWVRAVAIVDQDRPSTDKEEA